MLTAALLSACLAAPVPTPTPELVIYSSRAALLAMMDEAEAQGRKNAIPPGAWIVTATATAMPKPTKPPRLPQAKLEATCVAVGHQWFDGDGFILERASDRVVGFPVPAHWAAYCRRCDLWKEVKP